MRENEYQSKIIKRLKKDFPGCVVLKNDPNYIQGIPDLIMLYGDRWVALEVKANNRARHQPNQDYYILKMNEMSYAAFIYPENEEDVFNELQSTLYSEG